MLAKHAMVGSDSNEFGQLLQRYRRLRGLSQEQLADRAGLSRRGVSDLERGARRSPYPATVERLASALRLGPDQQDAFFSAANHTPGISVTTTDAAPTTLPPLPVSLNALVGRERELTEIQWLLKHNRLVTLTGAGGSGKTRLAIEVARASADRFRDGIALTLLAAVADPHLVLSTIAATLGVREAAERSLREAVIAYLRPRWVLLIVDNFEHVLSAAPEISDLLVNCPNVSALCTSRQPLSLHGEQLFSVQPLELPPVARNAPFEEVAGCASVVLFTQRAQSVVNGFNVTLENVWTVADICVRLDGLPLAIELAAARLKVLSPNLLLGRLERRLPLLVGGPRDLPARQRTLRDTIAWSYDLLDPADQRLFRRLAVFVGGFSLAASEALSEDNNDLGRTVLDGLASLVDINLLQRPDSGLDEPRFAMLETIREFAFEQLEASGEADLVRERHAKVFTALAEEGELSELWARRHLTALDLEQGNLVAALDWSIDAAHFEVGCRLMGALWHFWWSRNQAREMRSKALRLLERMRAHGQDGVSIHSQARALFAAGMLAESQDDVGAARPLLESALVLWRRCGDRGGLIDCLQGLATLMLLQTQDSTAWMQAVQLADESLSLARGSGETRLISEALMIAGLAHQRAGAYEKARTLLEESALLRRDANSLLSLGPSLGALGYLALEQRDFDAAGACFREREEIWRRLGDEDSLGLATASLGELALASGDQSAARAHFEQAVAIWLNARNITYRRSITHVLACFAWLAMEQGYMSRAATLAATATALRQYYGALALSSLRLRLDSLLTLVQQHTRTVALSAPAFGSTMSTEEAIRYALEEIGSP
jgi:predicted ATPase/DNA-binding XRE family transcriptional regulator